MKYRDPGDVVTPRGLGKTGTEHKNYRDPGDVVTPRGLGKTDTEHLKYRDPGDVVTPRGLGKTDTEHLKYRDPGSIVTPRRVRKTNTRHLKYKVEYPVGVMKANDTLSNPQPEHVKKEKNKVNKKNKECTKYPCPARARLPPRESHRRQQSILQSSTRKR